MKLSTCIKSGLGLIYTTVLLGAAYCGIVWATQYIIRLNWTGAILFWLIGIPILIGLFQFISVLAAIPSVYLLKGSKWLSWLLALPTIFFMFGLGSFFWRIASSIGGLLIWLVMISWFFETAWLFVAYFMSAIGSAYEEGETDAQVAA